MMCLNATCFCKMKKLLLLLLNLSGFSVTCLVMFSPVHPHTDDYFTTCMSICVHVSMPS